MSRNTKQYEGTKLSTVGQKEKENMVAEYFNEAYGSTSDKLNSLSRFKSRQNYAKDLCYYEMFKMTKGVLGNIVECGVYFGDGIFNYANLCASLEPYNYQTKIIGFDTFEGSIGKSQKDQNSLIDLKEGDYLSDSYEDLKRAIEIYDLDRPLNHLPKIELIKGDVRETSKNYVEQNPQSVIRILQLTMNFYEPTKAALECFYPKIPKGGIVMINALNYVSGATQALDEVIGIQNINLRTFDFYPNIVYFIKE
ncbi:MAG: TylF/MycF family methyltransferase [Sulfurimonas sp.]|uniref:TylF/MycF/NovP-related O-methyltransferase n=1 Tax=Sulfurimonas sp. TaxID=2022749 RepID=UPI002601185E|nr:TylF/MycF/NovP-related O-methyltransferase [Sulfurimonas sp.]MCK9492380.1 TylF/MycF family methyltransferase [Sulfurimonas sp.]